MRGETAETPRLLLGIVGGEAFAARQRNEVSAGAEALVARAGDDDHADFGIVLRLLQRGADASMDRCVDRVRSEEHTSELQSLMRISYAVFCLKKKNK